MWRRQLASLPHPPDGPIRIDKVRPVSNGAGSGTPLDNVGDHCAHPASCNRDRDPADFFRDLAKAWRSTPSAPFDVQVGFCFAPGPLSRSSRPGGCVATLPMWLGGVPPDRYRDLARTMTFENMEKIGNLENLYQVEILIGT